MDKRQYKPLSRRILSLAMLVVAVPALVSVVAVGTALLSNLGFGRIVRDELFILGKTTEMLKNSYSIRMDLREYVSSLDNYDFRASYRSNFRNTAKKLRKNGKELETALAGTAYGDKALPLLDSAFKELETFTEEAEVMFAAVDGYRADEFITMVPYVEGAVNHMKPFMFNFESQLEAIAAMSRQSFDNRFASLKRNTFLLSVGIGFLFLLGALVAIVTLSVYLRGMNSSLTRIVDKVRDLSEGEGDLTRHLEIQRDDEFGAIGAFLDNFLGHLNSLISRMQGVVSESRVMGGELASAAGETATSLDEMSKELVLVRDMTTELSERVSGMNGIFQTVSRFLGTVDGMIESQAADIEESSAAITEMTSSINSIRKTAENRVDTARNLLGTASDGRDRMGQTLTSIHNISQSANSILDMVRVINKIASQTNLLAMNAAIEAAHAGESGRGFSVVADEIRKLSEETFKNAKSISAELKSVVGAIAEADRSGTDTGRSFQDVVTRIEDVTSGIIEMGQTLAEVSEGNRQINDALSSLVTAASELRTSSGDLKGQMDTVGKSLNEFGHFTRDIDGAVSRITGSVGTIKKAGDKVAETGSHNLEMLREVETLIGGFKTRDT
jgi:methyl-accepting chemotaxis protein